jgi:hypothetical protein
LAATDAEVYPVAEEPGCVIGLNDAGRADPGAEVAFLTGGKVN